MKLKGKQENGGSDTNVVRQSVFPLISGSVMHPFHDCLYTYSCNDSTLQVLSSMLKQYLA